MTGGTIACLRAVAYVTVRRWVRRLRGVGGRPWALLGIALGVSLVVAAQVLVLRRAEVEAGLAPGLVHVIVRVAPLLLPFLLFRATSGSPLRLSVADVSWLLAAPGGARAVFAWHLLVRPVRYAAVGCLGTLLSRWWLGLPVIDAWKVAAAGAVIGLALRLVSYGGHLLAVRGRLTIPLRGLAVAWGLALASTAALDPPGVGWLRFAPVTGRVVTAVLDPAAVTGSGLLPLLAGLLAATGVLVAAARGFAERAEDRARQAAHAQETMRRSRSGQELGARSFRTGLRSLPGGAVLAGERALCYRVLAQERRWLRANLGSLAVFLAVALVLLAVWPSYVWVPAALLLGGSLFDVTFEGLAVELDHYHLRLAPLRPLRSLLWVGLVPAVRIAVGAEVLWLPALAAPRVTAGVWVAGAVLVPCAAALVVAASSLAATLADGFLVRLALAFALAVLGAAPAAGLLGAMFGLPAVVVPAGAALLAVAGAWVVLTRRRVWAPR